MTHQQRQLQALAQLDQRAAAIAGQVAAIIAENGPMAEFLGHALKADCDGMYAWNQRYGDHYWQMAKDLLLVAASVGLGRAVERLNEVSE